MDPQTLTLIGVVDTLQHVLQNEKSTAKKKDLQTASDRLENTRQELLTEGLRYNKKIATARDTIMDIARLLRGYLAEKREMDWILTGVQAATIQDVEPPPPPSSSSIGPKDLSPEITRLARALMDVASNRATSPPATNGNAGVQSSRSPLKIDKARKLVRK